MWDLIVSVPDHCLSFYFSQLNDYMNPYEYQRSRSFIDLGPRSLTFQGCPSIALSQYFANFYKNANDKFANLKL